MIDEKTLNDLKDKHGTIYVLGAKSGEEIVVRPPNDPEFGAYESDKEKRGSRAYKGLVRTCLVYPSDSEFLKMLNQRPALAHVFGLRVLEIAGYEDEATIKKV